MERENRLDTPRPSEIACNPVGRGFPAGESGGRDAGVDWLMEQRPIGDSTSPRAVFVLDPIGGSGDVKSMSYPVLICLPLGR